MKLVKKIWGKTALLTATGDFDGFVCNPFLSELNELKSEGHQYIVLNMKNVGFIDSTGIGCLLRCRKQLNSSGGDLVLSMPGTPVREALENLGLTEVLPIFETDEAAVSSRKDDDGIELEGSNNILIHLDEDRKAPLIGYLRKLEENHLVFETSETRLQKAQGTEVRVKFRLPLFKKSHYFDMKTEMIEMVHASTGTLIKARITQISEEDRTSIDQFLEDMRFLRSELKNHRSS